ncbi:hypothetical protein MNBD_IGNAVI01-380, partial [hydrothermal vent metagenome]
FEIRFLTPFEMTIVIFETAQMVNDIKIKFRKPTHDLYGW